MHKITNQTKGFSLIELLIVVAVIGILAAVAMPAYYHHVMRTRQAEAFENLLDMKGAQEMYYSLYNRYATSATDANYEPLLSFDFSDSRFYKYSIPSTATKSFTAQADGNNAHLNHDQWQITDDQSEPLHTGSPDGFSLSLF